RLSLLEINSTPASTDENAIAQAQPESQRLADEGRRGVACVRLGSPKARAATACLPHRKNGGWKNRDTPRPLPRQQIVLSSAAVRALQLSNRYGAATRRAHRHGLPQNHRLLRSPLVAGHQPSVHD